MKKRLLIASLAIIALVRCGFGPSTSSETRGDVFASAFAEHRGNFAAEGVGNVSRILPDDNEGSRHQRFIVTLSSGQTILIAHNIDLAPRVEGLVVGDSISFKGEYEWSNKGGVMPWTHRDPAGWHQAGWIRYHGKTYQ